ncbi:MAG: cytochrome P460 family protein [Actinobacteria bacterium]|nr:cytochrome P460 family protein [Actinomycetota bacterium]
MRTRLLAVALVAVLSATVVVVAAAETSANGLPSYTNGYQKWPKVNDKPILTDRLGAHNGVKNVYASKRKAGKKYPNGTVVVKTIVTPRTKYVGQFAVMRKVNGRWRYIEYERSSATARYTVLAQGQLCASCHVMAKSNDYVFTKR